jgi:tyrosyl-tRNA synthetase
MPILAGLDGVQKMSKSLDNYIGISDTPNEMFGKVMSIPDALMPNYFELLTDLPKARIASLTDASVTHPRNAKDCLARIIVETFHGSEPANRASTEFRRRFAEGQLPSDLEVRTIGQEEIGVLDLLRQVGFATSNSEARRLVQQGAVTLDGERIADPTTTIRIEGQPVLRVGKRRVCQLQCGPPTT